MRYEPSVVFYLVLLLGCGDGNKTSLDLVGQRKNTTQESPVQHRKVNSIKGLKDVLATDLLQDLYFRFARDKWHLSTADAQVNRDKLRQSGLDLVLAGIPIGVGRSPVANLKRAIEGTETLVAKGNGQVEMARSFEAAREIARNGRIAVMLLIEGADAFVGRPKLLPSLESKGILAVGLVGVRSNAFAESATYPRERGGLTEKGAAFLAKLRDAKIAVDLTHASPNTFWDVLSVEAGAVIVSHTACRALLDHPRNLDDLQILALARFGGLMGLIFNPAFLAKGGSASLEDIVAHILHVRKLGALKSLAIGSDFDGIEPAPRGMAHVGQLPRLWDALVEQGFTDDELKGVMGENSTRFFDELHREFGAVSHTPEEMLRPLPVDCDGVMGEQAGIPNTACDGFVLADGTRLPPTSRHRFRLKDVASTPVSLEIFGEPGARWQVEGQNLAGKILFHRFVQLSASGSGQMELVKNRNLTRLFLSPTQISTLNEAVIWGRPTETYYQ